MKIIVVIIGIWMAYLSLKNDQKQRKQKKHNFFHEMWIGLTGTHF